MRVTPDITNLFKILKNVEKTQKIIVHLNKKANAITHRLASKDQNAVKRKQVILLEVVVKAEENPPVVSALVEDEEAS